MVLDAFAAAVNAAIPSRYFLHTGIGVIGLFIIRAFGQGRKTTRDRDLHGRVVVITGAFTPLGLTLVQALAERGAHIIALAPEPITSPRIDLLVNALREQTKNERIFAEHCDVSSPRSVRDFCTKFLTGQETRIDALVFAHEYAHVGSVLPRPSPDDVKLDQQARTDGSMATFLMITLLLPALLVAPTERDIRVVSLVNPFYAAAAPSFDPDEPFHGIDQSAASKPPSSSTFLLEGRRALRTAILMRHLQRVLDALPNRGQAPATDSTQATVPVVSGSQQRSNIVSVAVSPGFSRSDTVSRILGATHDGSRFSAFGLFLYVILQPFLFMFVKSSWFAMQSILHALFVPTPFKSTIATPETRANSTVPAGTANDLVEEVLKPGALYAECAVVRVNVPPRLADSNADEKASGKGKTKAKEESQDDRPIMGEDGEMGGVAVGTMVWENFERALKVWEAKEPEPEPATEDEPTVDSPSPAPEPVASSA